MKKVIKPRIVIEERAIRRRPFPMIFSFDFRRHFPLTWTDGDQSFLGEDLLPARTQDKVEEGLRLTGGLTV